MSKPLSIDRAVDGNLKPVKDSDGTITALEVSTDTVRVKNLDIAGNISSPLRVDGNIVIDASGDITLDAAGGDIHFSGNGTSYLTWVATGILKMLAALDQDDFLAFEVINSGISVISTNDDSGGNLADLSLVADGDMILDSKNGVFIQKNNGTEFSAANSAYAGMILGYTVIGLDATPATFDVTNAMLPVHDDLKVSFTFPPSGKVEIMASIYIQSDAARDVTFGLSTTDASTGFTSLGAKYENTTYYGDETDGEQHSHRWYVTGTAGDTEELWFAAGTTQALRIDLFWGGDSSSVADTSHPMEYQPFVMKATALPSATYIG